MNNKKEYTIVLNNITKKYTKNKKNIDVLKNINYSFESGKMYYLYGKSGAGKTTLLNIIGTLIKSDSGEVTINGRNIESISGDQKSEIRNREIGFVFQSFFLIPTLTVQENILLPYYIKNPTKSKSISIDGILKKLDLIDRKDHYPNELSGGEQQRVAIARAIINNPSIILADEPTGSLDDENSEQVMMLLKKLSSMGKCVVVVSHDEKMKRYADVSMKLTNNGLKVFEGNNKI